jgi:hypothetical protein
VRTTLENLCRQGIIDDFDVREDREGKRLVVSIWMDGTSYNDRIVQDVRDDVARVAKQEDRPVLIVIGAIIERVLISGESDRDIYHQRVRRAVD